MIIGGLMELKTRDFEVWPYNEDKTEWRIVVYNSSYASMLNTKLQQYPKHTSFKHGEAQFKYKGNRADLMRLASTWLGYSR